MFSALALSLFVCLAGFTVIWLIHVWLEDAGVIDYYWSPGFLSVSAVHAQFYGFNPGSLLIMGLVLIWALRLTIHLVDRHRRMASEDARYAAMRASGGASFWWKSLFTIFLLQGFLQWVIASPMHAVANAGDFAWTDPLILFGLGLFVVGFSIETIADWQLRCFRFSVTTPNQLMQSGLWSRSRHPNYLGEMLLWVGIGIIGFAISGSMWAFLGPVILTCAMIFVSIPLTEQHLNSSRPDFAAYASRTPMLMLKIW